MVFLIFIFGEKVYFLKTADDKNGCKITQHAKLHSTQPVKGLRSYQGIELFQMNKKSQEAMLI